MVVGLELFNNIQGGIFNYYDFYIWWMMEDKKFV